MDRDDAAPSTRRPSTTLDRPSRTPFGPRIRTKTKHSADPADTPTSPLSSSALSRPDSPQDDADSTTPAPPSHADAAIQAPSSPARSAPAPQRSAPTTFVAPPPLAPPPAISFEPTPIPWKGLPYDAAQWTFSSVELQEIVSKAIRLSARESFVRLLSLQALEVDIVHEAARLDSERAAAQAKWRFEVGRRTMLMHALNSTVASSAPIGPAETDSANLVPAFIGQLASSIASCDSLLSSVLRYCDQQSQIAVVQHQHWASALGVALRKLNKAYERQGQELKRVQTRVQTLEDELEEAWREAEKMAVEFDELEQEVATSDGDGSGSVNGPSEEHTVPDAVVRELDMGTTPSTQTRQDPDDTGTIGEVTDIAVVVGVTATAVASKATLVSSPGSPRHFDKSDTKSIRSVKSTRSRRSTREGPSHVARLSAARSRSRAASNASLRLPKALRSPTTAHTPHDDAPPMPTLPQTTVQGRSFLDMGTVIRERVRKGFPPPRRPEPSVALPTPPHSAGLPPTRVPSVWVDTDDDKSARLNGLDRTHSLQIFPSLTGRTLKKTRRSNLVMSLTGPGSDRGSDSAAASPIDAGHAINEQDPGSGRPASDFTSVSSSGAGMGTGTGGTGIGTGTGAETRIAGTGDSSGSLLSNSSPISLPTHFHFRAPSDSSSNVSIVGVGGGVDGRPGSAYARLTTTTATTTTGVGMRVSGAQGVPRRSLMSRASSVILRRLSQATIGSTRTRTRTTSGSTGSNERLSPSRSREALRLSGSRRTLVEWWRDRDGEEGQGLGEIEGEEEDEGEDHGEEGGGGEVMVIGSPLAE